MKILSAYLYTSIIRQILLVFAILGIAGVLRASPYVYTEPGYSSSGLCSPPLLCHSKNTLGSDYYFTDECKEKMGFSFLEDVLARDGIFAEACQSSSQKWDFYENKRTAKNQNS